jgi:hypothetical protein
VVWLYNIIYYWHMYNGQHNLRAPLFYICLLERRVWVTSICDGVRRGSGGMHIPEHECRSFRPLEVAGRAIRRIGQPESDARDYTAKYEALINISR